MSTELRRTHPLLGTRVNKGRDGRLTPPPLASGWSRHPIGYDDPQNDEVKGHRQQFCGSKESHHEEQREDSSSHGQHPPPAKRNPPPYHCQRREDKDQCCGPSEPDSGDRKSTRLNSSHANISYA